MSGPAPKAQSPRADDDDDESVLPDLDDDGDDESIWGGSVDVSDDKEEESAEISDDDTEEPALVLPSWTPSTTHLLLCPSLSSADDAACPYFDILDHVLRGTCGGSSLSSSDNNKYTPAQIRRELQALQDEGIIGSLQQARTAMEVQSDAISALLGSFGASTAENGRASIIALDKQMVRGDRSAFIPRTLHRPALNANYDTTFARRCPALRHLISSIEHTVQGQLGHVLDIDTDQTSVQVATYPGDGKSGYPRHCDRGDQCASEPYPLDDGVVNATNTKKKRIITAVYYLTPADWDAKADSGALRIYRPGSSDTSWEEFCDAIPYSDRLVVFRSDLVEHEVLPSLRRERTAITVWMYGDIKSGVAAKPAVSASGRVLRNGAHQRRTIRNPPPPLPIRSNSCSGEDRPRIFVTIPAYRDPETNKTICSLYETAKYPDRISIGVIWQVDTSPANADSSCFAVQLPDAAWSTTNVRQLTLDYRHATGPCLARAMAQSLHRGEEYILQVDSHMRFRENWDEYLLQQISQCPDPDKSVLTAYPPAYVLDANGEAECVNNETRSTILVPWKFSDSMLRQKGRLLQKASSRVIPCPLYAAGFNFSSASVIKDCPYDGTLHHLFFGEEMSMAVRLYTHGYDFLAPCQSVCYHKWTRDHRPTIQEDTKVNGTQGVGSVLTKAEHAVQEQRTRSIAVVLSQLRGTGPGLGTVRTATDFASRVGVCFADETFAPDAENGGLSPDSFAPTLGFLDEGGGGSDGSGEAPVEKKEILSLVSSFLDNM